MISTPILQVENLSLRRKISILNNINWKIFPGEHWVLLGANGSGKTSLLSSLVGYLPPTSGKITVLGSTYGSSNWRELRKKVGLVSPSVAHRIQNQETAFWTVLSGREAMINYWGTQPPEAQKQEALDILKKLQCATLADRPWAHLSQGERQKVLIGRALMARYQILILDEPCAGLDMLAREEFLVSLNKVAAQAKAPNIIFVTHHVEEIIPIFSHLLLLKDGAVLKAGKRSEVLTEKNLQATFGAALKLNQIGPRYQASLTTVNLGAQQ